MFAEHLKTLRKLNNISQYELAEELGLSNRTISMYERGACEPTLSTLIKISNYFNIPIDILIDSEKFQHLINIEKIVREYPAIKKIILSLQEVYNNKLCDKKLFYNFCALLISLSKITCLDEKSTINKHELYSTLILYMKECQQYILIPDQMINELKQLSNK